MKIEIDTVKGFRDFLPPESLKRQAVREVIEKYFRLYGFLPVETPVIEYDELMRPNTISTEQQDQAISDRFRLKDRANRSLGLRYEFTFQLARILKQNPTIKMPFRRYQIGTVFRDEPVATNRFRQFIQCDADIIGSSDLNSDFECISLITDILKALKIKAEIIINNRKLLTSIIESVQIEKPENIMRELDKLEKIGEDEVKINLRKYTSTNQVITLFKLLEKDLKFFTENAFEGAEEVESLLNKCKSLNITVKFNPYLARGLSYYTGSIFEIISTEQKGSIAAGGRYDKLVGKYLNKEIPAVGISFGLERVTQLAKITPRKPVKVLLISIEEETETIKLAGKLRKAKIPCITAFGSPSKQLEFANASQIPYVIFVGPDEVAEKEFKLKNMQTGEQKKLKEDELIKKLSN